MLQSLCCCDPFGRVDGQHFVDEVFCFRSDGVPLGGGKLQEDVNMSSHTKQPETLFASFMRFEFFTLKKSIKFN